MNASKTLLMGLLLFAGHLSYGQQSNFNPKSIKFGKIEREEFQTQVTGTDSAASAVVLFDIGKGYFEDNDQTGLQFVFERHARIKIIKKDGYSHANLELQFYRNNSSGTNLASIDAATYNLENGQMVASKIGKDAKFTERQDRNYTVKKFTLPNVHEGSIIEYKYKINSHFLFTLMPWIFQRDIPTLYSEYGLSVPEFCRYHPYTTGQIDIHPHMEDVNRGMFLHYYAKNVPALKDENYVASMDNYRSRVSFELSSITIPGRVYEDISSSWPKAIASIKKEETFGGFVIKNNYARNTVASLIKDPKDTMSIVSAVFSHTRDNLKWNGQFNFSASASSPKSVFEKKTGNSADINLSLLTLLREANIEAYPVLLSTRSNGMHPGFPQITGFDNVIVAVKNGNGHILLDATDKNHAPGLIAYENLNHEGLLVDLDAVNGRWISLEADKPSQRNISMLLKLDENNKLSGTAYITSTAYEGLKRRNQYQKATDESEFLKSYKEDKPGLDIKSYKITNLENPEESLSETIDLDLEQQVEEAGNLAYFTPLLFERTKENPFSAPERLFPVDFAYPIEENYRITLEFPEKYIIEKTPKNEKIMLPDNRGTFTFIFRKEGNTLLVQSRISINSSAYGSEEYQSLKELFINIVRKQAEQVVFKRS